MKIAWLASDGVRGTVDLSDPASPTYTGNEDAMRWLVRNEVDHLKVVLGREPTGEEIANNLLKESPQGRAGRLKVVDEEDGEEGKGEVIP